MNDEIKEILDEPKILQLSYGCYISLNDYFKLRDYITNLKEENERLKEENKHIFSKVNDDELLISNAMNYAEAQDYKSRVEKAVEYIKKDLSLGVNTFGSVYSIGANEVLNILQNGSDEE